MGGRTEIVKGRIKEAAGALIGNHELREEGKADQIAGNAKQAVEATVERAKKAAQNAVDTLRNQLLMVVAAWSVAMLVGSALQVPAASAQDASPAKRLTAANTSRDVKGNLEWGPVRSARSLLGAVVKNRDGSEFGRIKDVGLNIGQGTVAAIFVMPIGGKRELRSVPITTLQWTSAGGDIVLDSQPETPPALSSPNDPNATSRVVLFSKLGDIPVHNARGDKLGDVVDFGLARQKGLISYAILVLEAELNSADTLYPIPLAAFVVQADAKRWILELPEGVLENTPTIKKDQWPTTIPAAWVEYVSVRYGHSPSGGVQSELRERK